MEASVRCWVAPGGVWIKANRMPWSSAGRNALGKRRNSIAIAATSARNTRTKRSGRARIPRTPP